MSKCGHTKYASNFYFGEIKTFNLIYNNEIKFMLLTWRLVFYCEFSYSQKNCSFTKRFSTFFKLDMQATNSRDHHMTSLVVLKI
jgi:hypothetical protein